MRGSGSFTLAQEIAMAKRILIRDLTLRDGQQSQFATRMTQAQVDRVLPHYRKAGFYAMEVWGGAVPDSVMRYLGESPWTRLETIKAGVGDTSLLTALSRGRNLFGYMPYPDSVIEGFCRNAVRSGIGIMRIFDALNDLDNMTSTIKYVKENGGKADCAVCYTVDPRFTRGERWKAFFGGQKLPRNLFGIPYFVAKARELERLGADLISIKDMAGLIDPLTSGRLVRALKAAVSIPIDLHTHCTPGFGTASVLMAMVAGVDVVDAVILPFSGGPAAPAFELVQLFADRLGLETGVDLDAVYEIDRELRTARAELSKFDQYQRLPPAYDIRHPQLPSEVAQALDAAVAAARADRADEVLRHCQRLETWLNYPDPDEIVRTAQIPGGMYTNMMAQLKESKLEHLVNDVLGIVPRVRLDCGVPPLVTPTSQIVGAQAVNCIIDQTQGKPFYTNVSKNFAELVKGTYGRTPFPVDPAFRERVAGVREETAYDTSKYQPQPNPVLVDLGGARLARDEKEQLLLELFPSVADKYLRGVREAEHRAWLVANPPRPEPEVPNGPWAAAFWEEQLSHVMEA
jgi:oxaloacetate decarboxylase alpha subunit/pyruvate carboxylase subunit B